MREHGGAILNVVSTGGIRPARSSASYNVSKAALIHLTKQLALELAPSVRVNAIAPGLVKTQFARALWEPDEAGIAARHPLRRIGVPDDIAGARAVPRVRRASWITGEVYRLDGGMLARLSRSGAALRRLARWTPRFVLPSRTCTSAGCTTGAGARGGALVEVAATWS